jgi:hypothetical protein
MVHDGVAEPGQKGQAGHILVKARGTLYSFSGMSARQRASEKYGAPAARLSFVSSLRYTR